MALANAKKEHIANLDKVDGQDQFEMVATKWAKKKMVLHPPFSKVGGIGKMNLVGDLLPSLANFPKGDIKQP